jgi:hypothetical protein
MHVVFHLLDSHCDVKHSSTSPYNWHKLASFIPLPGGRDTPGRGIHSSAEEAYWDNTRVVSLDERNTGTEQGYARRIEADRDKAGL